jgi:hypothetical protein
VARMGKDDKIKRLSARDKDTHRHVCVHTHMRETERERVCVYMCLCAEMEVNKSSCLLFTDVMRY